MRRGKTSVVKPSLISPRWLLRKLDAMRRPSFDYVFRAINRGDCCSWFSIATTQLVLLLLSGKLYILSVFPSDGPHSFMCPGDVWLSTLLPFGAFSSSKKHIGRSRCGVTRSSFPTFMYSLPSPQTTTWPSWLPKLSYLPPRVRTVHEKLHLA